MTEILPYEPSLNALNPDEALFSVLIMQPRGQLRATPQGVINADSRIAFAKAKQFCEVAVESHADLALTPEYCCPWTCIEDVILAGSFPQPGKLWVIGCESITRDALLALIDKFSAVDWKIDQQAFDNAGNFFDPVCLCFVNPNVHEKRWVVAVQFKMQAMADHDAFLERDNMIPGTRRYVLQNNDASVRLTCLICSDALGFTLPMLGGDYLHRPYIILHPQLNKDPRHVQFRNYRAQAYLRTSLSKEFLSYNWARGTEITNGIRTRFGGTALFTKAPEINLTDAQVVNNHSLGMYYTNCHPHRSSVFFLNFDEHMFFFRTTKVSQEGAMAALVARTGPDMVDAWSWDAVQERWASSACDDGFLALCKSIGGHLSPLDDENLSAIDKERLLSLASGNLAKLKQDPWWKVLHIPSFQILEDEVIHRSTVTQDPDKPAADVRHRILSRYSVLAGTIIPNAALYPDCIADLAGFAAITYPIPGKPDCNLAAADKTPASAAYVGTVSPAFANEKFDGMFRCISEDSRRRLVLWYSVDGDFNNISKPPGKIDDDLREDPSSIAKEL